jgi:hypothetical protein
MEPSGWRLMVPPVDAPDAPPLVVALGEVRARVHLLISVPDDDLGEPTGTFSAEDIELLHAAAQRLLTGSPAPSKLLHLFQIAEGDAG